MGTAIDYGVEDVREVVAEVFRLEFIDLGRELTLHCPNPDHNDSKPSCSINSITGLWNCFSCEAGGDIADLGALVLHQTLNQVSAVLSPHTPEARLAALKRRVERLSERAAPVSPSEPVRVPRKRAARFPIDALMERQFTYEQQKRWDIAWITEQKLQGSQKEFNVTSSIGIPIKDSDSTLQAWCYGATRESASWQPKYLYTPGVEINELWFGLQHHTDAEHITVVEGALDAMWADQCGVPALALLGSKMGDKKIRWLQRYKSVTLMPDRDQAGLKWAVRVGDALVERVPVRVAQYRPWMLRKRPVADGSWPEAKDPEDLRPIDLEIMLATASPYMMWRRRIANFIPPEDRRRRVRRVG